MANFDLRSRKPVYSKSKVRAPIVVIGTLSSLGLAAIFGFWSQSALPEESAQTLSTPSLEESLRLEGEVISFHAAKHSVHQSALFALQSSIESATTKVVKPELAEWDHKAVKIAGVIEANQSLFAALSTRNVDADSIQRVIVATNSEFNFRKKSKVGDKWSADIGKDGSISSFKYQSSPEDIWITSLNKKKKYKVKKVVVPVDIRTRVASGKIQSSLWKALANSSAGARYVTDFIDLFAYKIDFGTQTRPGDEFTLVYEEVFLEGSFLRYGDVLAAHYRTSEGKEFFGFRYQQGKDISYFDQNGDSLKGQFLKSPLASAKITSSFGRRFHPILKKMKMHQGVDYAAPTGTPVQSIASGVVLHAGWQGSNGKLVSIKHSNGYVTHYAHLSQIKSGLKRGSKVTQKTVIGKVGSTGRSTGAHLHLGMSKNGKYINPLSIKLVKGDRVPAKTMKTYKKKIVLPMMKQLRNVLASDPDG